MSKKVRNYLLTGLIVILPAAVTLYGLWLVFKFVDNLAGSLVAQFTGWHIPGLGVLATFLVVLLAGLLTTNIVGRTLVNLWENLLFRIPLVNSIYKTVKQILESFWKDKEAFQQVVLVEYPRKGLYSLAFVTGETKGEVQQKTNEKVVNVFLPTSPNPTSGFLLLVPQKDIIPLEMSVQDGLKMVVSGGIVTPEYAPGRNKVSCPEQPEARKVYFEKKASQRPSR